MSKLLLVIALLSGLFSFEQATSPLGRQSRSLLDLIQQKHFDPVPMDDSASAFIYVSLLEEMDPNGMLFLKKDLDEFEQYRYDIDDQIKGGYSTFYDLFTSRFKQRLEEGKVILDGLEGYRPDFSKNDHIELDENGFFKPCVNEQELNDKWQLWLKYAILEEIFEYNYVPDPLTAPIDSLLMQVPGAQKNVIDDRRFGIKSYLEHPAGYEIYMQSFYLDAIAKCFDPHSTYFSPVEKENFEDELSRGNFSFGFSVEEDDERHILISDLIPGSPAWNCNQINTGDELLRVVMDDGMDIDLGKKNLEDLILFMANSTAEGTTLYLKKVDGKQENVHLIKGEIYVEEDVIKSVILQGDKKVGYITLPDFYTDWDDKGTLGCANDVAKAIVKLQKENINGLILDFRNNGGGSLKEAIDLCGIFIDWGPLCIYRDRETEPATIKDMNKGTIYTGPLVILVNSLSASATEIFAAAMQDYNRAIIVGSPTYGKATGQIIIPVARDLSDEMGYIKLTTSKYYRVNKGTHQLSGVKPNVTLKDIFELYDYHESCYPNALPADSVSKKIYFNPLPEFPNAELQKRSTERTEKNSRYVEVNNMLDSIMKTTVKKGVVSLEINQYQQEQKEFETLLNVFYEEGTYRAPEYKVVNNQYDRQIMEINKHRSALNEEYLNRIQSDLYIEEAYNILLDYMDLLNK